MSGPVIDYWGHGYATGYGIASQRLVHALIASGVKVRWNPIDFGPVHPWFPPGRPSHGDLDDFRATDQAPDVVVVHAVPEILPAAFGRGDGVPIVCHTVWETDRIQKHWPELLNRCDLVVVPTEWNAEVFRQGGVTTPVAVVPHSRAVPTVAPDTGWLDPFGDRFLVYTIAAWSGRKAPWRTLECIAEALGPDEDAAVIVVSGAHVEEACRDESVAEPIRAHTWAALGRTLGRLGPMPEVHLFDHHLSDAAIAGLHARGDCWVSLPHGEGWDLGAFDAALAGTPVVTTNWGAPADYLDPDASWLVPARTVPAGPAHPRDEHGARWAAPDLDAAAAMLREVRSDPAAACRRAERQVDLMEETYAPSRVAATFLDALSTHLRL